MTGDCFWHWYHILPFNPIALSKAKIVYNFTILAFVYTLTILAFLSAIGLRGNSHFEGKQEWNYEVASLEDKPILIYLNFIIIGRSEVTAEEVTAWMLDDDNAPLSEPTHAGTRLCTLDSFRNSAKMHHIYVQ